jgi:protein-tyrosine phosphatase
MNSVVYWIDATPVGRLAILSRPRAGDWLEDEIAAWRAAGFAVVLSLLERAEVEELELQREAPLCEAHGLELISFPIADRGRPESTTSTLAVVDRLATHLRAGQSVGIHCRAGIGRSALMAASVLVRLGAKPAVAFQAIAATRRVPVPDTDEQRCWVDGFYVFCRG